MISVEQTGRMLKLIAIIVCFNSAFAYFTIPGRCPENIAVKEDFRLADFYGKWYEAYHYSSDGRNNRNNCSTMELITRPSGVHWNQSRIDNHLFHKFSIAKVKIPSNIEDAAKLDLIFNYKDAPRRWKTRKYNFHVLATNYNYYATVYTCQYSQLIDKHFIYIWILSRNPILNDVSKELAVKPLQQLGVTPHKLVQDKHTHCAPKYYNNLPVEPTTFNLPVPVYS